MTSRALVVDSIHKIHTNNKILHSKMSRVKRARSMYREKLMHNKCSKEELEVIKHEIRQKMKKELQKDIFVYFAVSLIVILLFCYVMLT